MPIAIIAAVVVAVVAVVGVVVSRDGTPATDQDVAVQSLPTNDGPEPESETVVDEGGLSADAEMSGELPNFPADADGPAVSGIADVDVEMSQYEDGVYEAMSSYFTPRNTEHEITVSLTVANDVVVAADILYDNGGPKNGSHERFDAAFNEAVIGVTLDDVSLSRTGGASLTSDAFNEAVDTIKKSAAA